MRLLLVYSFLFVGIIAVRSSYGTSPLKERVLPPLLHTPKPESGPGFFITTPRTYHAGEYEKIIVHATNLQKDEKIKFELKKGDKKKYVEQWIKANNVKDAVLQEIDFPVPSSLSGKAQLTVSVDSQNFERSLTVDVIQSTNKIFIQTDKPMYKPGSKVQFRVIIIDKELKPASGQVVQQVYIANPSGSRIKQWRDVSLDHGMVSLDMKLSEQPVLGDWKITAVYQGAEESKQITIKKYVLPKFEISIKPPSYIMRTANSIPVTVCAKYTYGKPVTGNITAKICMVSKDNWRRPSRDFCVELSEKVNGCSEMLFGFNQRLNYIKNGEINVTVVEDGTGVRMNATELTPDITADPVKMAFDLPKYFRPGFPFTAKLTVSTPDGRPAPPTRVAITRSSDQGKDHVDTVVVRNGVHVFTVIPADVSSYSFRAKYTLPAQQTKHASITNMKIIPWDDDISSNVVTTSARMVKWYSPSKTYIEIGQITHDALNEVIHVNVRYKGAVKTEATMNFILTCRGKIVQNNAVKLRIDDVITFKVSEKMYPKCRLMAFTILDDGEFIADHKVLSFESPLKNKVSLSFLEEEKKPGETVGLLIKASAGSKVAVAAVDKSVLLLGETNDINKQQINEFLSSQDVTSSGKGNNHCKRSRRFGHFRSSTSRVDSSTAIAESGLIYFSNRKVDHNQCPPEIWRRFMVDDALPQFELAFVRRKNIQPMMLQKFIQPVRGTSHKDIKMGIDPPDEKKTTEEPVKLRTEFPETWLWFEESFNEFTQEKTITATVPDTMTTWYASGFAMSPTHGIGVADPTSVKSFLPFFVSLSLPYSVIRGESVKLPTTVFNYLEKCLVIELTLKPSDEFVTVGNSITKLCVCGGKSKTFKFAIKPSKLGKVDVHVQAISIAPDQTVCTSNEIMESLAASDAVNKKLLVEPEGIKKEQSISTFFCNEDDDDVHSESLKLTIPDQIVPDSLYTTVSVVGDLMGPTMDGLDKLLKMPYGCGEQNMINFAPNIYVMDYLTATGQVTEKIKSRAIRFMESGYQRELTYKHTDGAYSAFGTGEGSTWLTAFVLRSYSQAQKYIFIDEDEISISKKWLLNLQMDNGCFEEKGMIHHKEMKGGVSGRVTMTAFVLAALLEAKIPKDDGRIKKAVTCMTNGIRDVTDPMHLAVVGYALSLAESPKQLEVLEKLISLAKTDDGLMHWEAVKTDQPSTTHSYYHAPRPADIEMTAYALMMYINVKPTDKREHLRIVQWLAKQRNAYGGFSSTQDTCVGLQALSKYSTGSLAGSYSMNVEISNNNSTIKQFAVNSDNKILLQRHFTKERFDDVQVIATGVGCALVQASVKYNVDDVTDDPSFSLHVNVNNANTLTCKHDVKVCGSYLKNNSASNMALIDVTMVSGFEPILNELDIQTQSVGSSLQKYEFNDGVVSLYFDEFVDTSTCVNFSIEQVNEVGDRKPAAVKIYDYYDADDQATMFYKVEDCPEINHVS